ncbi:hypothetical protein [Flavobacterium beibuense]|uniref:hypothetical protein n=1 Tax=Flavobacterium beibuense TaxID=657326 RepID=UPI003A8DF1AD
MPQLISELKQDEVTLGYGLYFKIKNIEPQYIDHYTRDRWIITSNIPDLDGLIVHAFDEFECYEFVMRKLNTYLIIDEHENERISILKKTVTLILSFVLGFILMYSIFSFIKLNCNVITWDDGERASMVILGAILSLIIFRFRMVLNSIHEEQ